MKSSPIVCVDASLVTALVVGDDRSARIAEHWDHWLENERVPAAPALLFYELTNALHRYRVTGHLTSEQVSAALDAAQSLGIETIENSSLHQEALALAESLDLPAAYDCHYLALTLRLHTELWTLDQRFARRCEGRFNGIRLVE